LQAVIRAFTLDPSDRVYGAAFKVEIGMVQVTGVPVQLAKFDHVLPLLPRISTLYDVIAEPPFEEGAVQSILTLMPSIAVVGAAGVEGTVGITAPLPSGD